ncbi:MAG: C4-dicarboxylate ABC transporter substrate-binding protein, partial [Treponema sp.]|nr:C4-dicarboxylate ABC transporter substrate-binding protein [Treponema sp.]
WDSLSEKQQDILFEAGKYAGEVCRKISQEREENARAQLAKEGAKFTEITDLSSWQKACEGIISDTAKADSLLYQKILHLTK